MGKEDLIIEAFGYLNSFKRHRSLYEIKPHDKMYHELQMYKMIDKLELSMRAIKKEMRDSIPVMPFSEDESND